MARVLHKSHKEWQDYIECAPEPLPPPPGYRLLGNPEIGTRQRDLYMNACLLFYYFLQLDNDPGLTLIDHLIKGRSDEDLAAAFKAGFATIGITLK